MRQEHAWRFNGSSVHTLKSFFIQSRSLALPFCAVGRLNRPGLMVYGGTIRAGSCEGAPQLDIVSAFQAYGKFLQDGRTPEAERERYNTVRHACPGPGACGGVSKWFHTQDWYSCAGSEDVHSKHYGQRCRGFGDDITWIILFPGRIHRKARRVRFRRCIHVQSSLEEHSSAGHNDSFSV